MLAHVLLAWPVMKIALLHNEDAGDGASPEDLQRDIEAAGHEVVHDIEKSAEFVLALTPWVDLVVVAGGDGTVRGAVHAIRGQGVPLAILPLGTANNIARSLGIEGTSAELARGWAGARRVSFDLGLARGPWGASTFLEGVGAGLVPSAISAAQAHGKSELAESPDGPLAGARAIFRETLAALTPRRLKVTADGEALDGEYLIVEALNIRSVGPNLRLSADASPSDGMLDLVIAGEQDRDELLAMVDAGGSTRRSMLPLRRVRSVEIGDWRVLHVDDALRTGSKPGPVTIEIEQGQIDFLA